MLRILQRYVLREVLVPSVLALAILTFLVLARTVFTVSGDMPISLSLGISLRLVAYLLPSLMTVTVPLALLVGVLLGIGRLTVDSEIKACRTHGVNLFRTFLPVLVLGVAATLVEVWNGTTFAPRMAARSADLIDRITQDAINSLEPGKFQGGLDIEGQAAVVYFKEKDPLTGVLGGIYVSLETPTSANLDAKESSRPRPAAPAGAAPTTSTVRSASAAANEPNRALVKTVFLARSGEIATDLRQRSASLVLRDGTIHYLADREDPRRRYELLEFGVLSLGGQLKGKKIVKEIPAMTYAQLGERIAELEAGLPAGMRERSRSDQARLSQAVREIWRLGAERLSRLSIALACFAFVLIGVPLAVYIRPSGKAVGVSISFALFMVYYGFWYSALHLAKKGIPAGPVLFFLPIGLLVVLGAVLLYRVVRR